MESGNGEFIHRKERERFWKEASRKLPVVCEERYGNEGRMQDIQWTFSFYHFSGPNKDGIVLKDTVKLSYVYHHIKKSLPSLYGPDNENAFETHF